MKTAEKLQKKALKNQNRAYKKLWKLRKKRLIERLKSTAKNGEMFIMETTDLVSDEMCEKLKQAGYKITQERKYGTEGWYKISWEDTNEKTDF